MAPTGTVPSPLIADLREHLAMSSLVSPGHMLFSQAYKDLLLSFVSEGSFGFTNASSSSHSVGCTLLSSIGGLTHLEALNQAAPTGRDSVSASGPLTKQLCFKLFTCGRLRMWAKHEEMLLWNGASWLPWE